MDVDFSKIKLEIVYVEYQDLKTSFSFVELAINPRLYNGKFNRGYDKIL